jgi:C-terminal processing protease CtpA/Prc
MRGLAIALFAMLLGGCAGATQGTIGAMLTQGKKDGRVYVREVPAGLGAAKAGLEVGDEILSVDGRDVRPLSPKDLREALGGELGETVRLTVFRQDRVLRLAVTRTALPKGP